MEEQEKKKPVVQYWKEQSVALPLSKILVFSEEMS
jgi:hypothetical protein